VGRRTRILGPDHPDTLQSRTNLAAAYWSAGRTAEAITMHEANLKLRESKLGPDHPDTLASRHNLAEAYWSAGRTTEAVTVYEANLKLCESKLGPDHPHTLITMNNLARAYQAAGRLTDALPLFEGTLMRCKSKLGPDHPNTLQIMNNLAGAYLDARRWAEAENTARECLGLREKKRPDDWWRFHTMSQLGAALAGQEKYAEAEPLLLQGYDGLKAREKAIPPPAATRLPEALDRLIELSTATNRPDEVKRWQAERARYANDPTPRAPEKK
jgi:tetratricopeptide (TPR) repeat protein